MSDFTTSFAKGVTSVALTYVPYTGLCFVGVMTLGWLFAVCCVGRVRRRFGKIRREWDKEKKVKEREKDY